MKHLPSALRMAARDTLQSFPFPFPSPTDLGGEHCCSCLHRAFNCKLQGCRKMATSHGPHSTVAVQLAKMKVIYLPAQWTSAGRGRGRWGCGTMPSCTQCQLNPDAALRQPLNLAFTPVCPSGCTCPSLDKCLKIKLQKYFNILWQHAGAPTESPLPASSLLPLAN